MIKRSPIMRSAIFCLLLSGLVCCLVVNFVSGSELVVLDIPCADSNAFRQVSGAVVDCIDRAETNALVGWFTDKRENGTRFLESACSNGLLAGFGWQSEISSLIISEKRSNVMSGRFHWRRMGIVPAMTVMGAVNEGVERNFACEVTMIQTSGEWKVEALCIAPAGISDEQLKSVENAISTQKARLSGRNVSSQEVESAYSGIAYLHLSVGRNEEAVLAARQSVAASPNYISYFLLGRALMANRSWRDAHDAFMAASACVKEGMMQKDAVRQAMECSILCENERSVGK